MKCVDSGHSANGSDGAKYCSAIVLWPTTDTGYSLSKTMPCWGRKVDLVFFPRLSHKQYHVPCVGAGVSTTGPCQHAVAGFGLKLASLVKRLQTYCYSSSSLAVSLSSHLRETRTSSSFQKCEEVVGSK